MDRHELMRRMRETTIKWNKRYADQIPSAYPSGSMPHDGSTSDFAEHHADMSAPEHYSSILEEQQQALLDEYNAPGNREQRLRDAAEMGA